MENIDIQPMKTLLEEKPITNVRKKWRRKINTQNNTNTKTTVKGNLMHMNVNGEVCIETRRGSRGGIWGFIPPQFFGSENYLKCLS